LLLSESWVKLTIKSNNELLNKIAAELSATEVAQLQVALSEALQSKDKAIHGASSAIEQQDKLQSQIDDLKTKATALTMPCLFLTKLAIETRNQIYSLSTVLPPTAILLS
jgi:hypothetical protein